MCLRKPDGRLPSLKLGRTCVLGLTCVLTWCRVRWCRGVVLGRRGSRASPEDFHHRDAEIVQEWKRKASSQSHTYLRCTMGLHFYVKLAWHSGAKSWCFAAHVHEFAIDIRRSTVTRYLNFSAITGAVSATVVITKPRLYKHSLAHRVPQLRPPFSPRSCHERSQAR